MCKMAHASINYEFKMGHIVGNKLIKEMEINMGINHLILQASLSLGETGITWQSAQLD